MRDDKWLFSKLDYIWDNHFPDVPQENDVRIVWGKRARTRLGSIRQSSSNKIHTTNKAQSYPAHPTTQITINSLFKDEKIPEYVVLGTIAHELAHYAHGFHSPLEQKFDTPHAGGIIHKEFKERGLDSIHKNQKKWLKENWREYVLSNFPPKKRPRRQKIIIRWI